MADSVATVTPLEPPLGGSDRTQKIIRAYFSVSVDAGDYTTGGILMDLSDLVRGLPVTSPPIITVVKSETPAAAPNTVLWSYHFAKGTTLANGKLQAFGVAATNGLTEASAAATPATVVADTIKGYADFQFGT